MDLSSRLAQSLDALRAQHLMHGVTAFHHNGLLQVRFELAVGRSLGKGAVVPEGCGFATVCAFCHEKISFLAIIPSDFPSDFRGTVYFLKARHFTT
jgi:hypothetical protein